MPEGPSIVLLKEEAQKFIGRKVLAVKGNAKTLDIAQLQGKKIIDLKTWGKHFLICFPRFTVRIHFLLFGFYQIDSEKENRLVRLHLKFTNGEINFYACSVKLLEGSADDHYDWSTDVMNEAWDPRKASRKISQVPSLLICDTLLDQNIFAGVGNIIKNEVLYRVGVHPESKNGKIPRTQLSQIIREARKYSFQFLEWKRNYVLKKHWLAHTKKVCTKCGGLIIRKVTGKTSRRSFFCPVDQTRYK